MNGWIDEDQIEQLKQSLDVVSEISLDAIREGDEVTLGQIKKIFSRFLRGINGAISGK